MQLNDICDCGLDFMKANDEDKIGLEFLRYDRMMRSMEPKKIKMVEYLDSKILRDRIKNEAYGTQHGMSTPVYMDSFDAGNVTIYFEQTKQYENKVDGFLFDTKTPAYGGSGVKFDWNMLEYYTGTTPFLLSGGIGKEDAKAILQIQHPLLAGIDLNSKFEISPALKNTKDLQYFIQIIRKK
jgi:phosphoribosylanthranilate isomerase